MLNFVTLYHANWKLALKRFVNEKIILATRDKSMSVLKLILKEFTERLCWAVAEASISLCPYCEYFHEHS